ncbi:MAG: hypothetical protein U9M89_00600, partial [Patescibacteria group bacterium]|nr:hypothetical protein [Patescibacteria group bacterium]
MENQRTPSKPVGDGLAREIGRMMEDAARKYNGGTERMDLVKGHPQFIGRVYELWEKLFVEQKHRLEIMSGFRPIWRTINLGTGLSSEREFVDAMKDKGIINVSYPERGFGSAVFIGSSELTSV